MSSPAPRLATYEDLLALSEDVRAQIFAGEIVVTPSPLPRHSRAQRAIGSFIGRPFDDDDGYGGPGGWWIFPEIDVRFTQHDVVRPDLAGWRRVRLPNPGSARPIEVVPDWVCEIVSPSTASIDRVTKRALYAQHGVGYYWIVDPAARTLEALQLQAGRWIELGAWDDTAVVRIPPFEALELDVSRLFLPREADPQPEP